MCGMRALVVVFAVYVVSCSHPPPPEPPAVEHPVKTFGAIAGKWVTSDDMDWFYELTIRADGDFALVIDRGKLGRCTTHATLVQAKPPSFELAVALDECHRDRQPGAITAAFPSFTTGALTLELTDAGQTSHHTFSRAPDQ